MTPWPAPPRLLAGANPNSPSRTRRGLANYRSPQAALALETNKVTKIPAVTVIVIAREIVFIVFLFLSRANPACTLKSAIRSEKLEPVRKKFYRRALSAEFGQQPRPSQLPIAHHGVGGDFHHLGGLLYAQAPEKSQFDNPGFARVHFSQRLQRIVQRNQFTRLICATSTVSGEIQRLRVASAFTAALRRARSSRMRRISVADTAKKCARCCQSTSRAFTRLRYTS